MKTSYRELDYGAGKSLQALRIKIGLTQQELGDHLGTSARAVRKWEAGGSYPTAEHLKALLALAFQHQAWPCGAEMEEMRALWNITRQKRSLDEHWLSALLDQQNSLPEQALQLQSYVEPEPIEETLTGLDAVVCQPQGQSQESHLIAATIEAPSPLSYASLPQTSCQTNVETLKTRGRRKWLLPMLIALIILTIIASAGTLFFYARGQTTDQTYPGYLAGHGTLAFSDPLSRPEGSRWAVYSTNRTGGSCQFIGGRYHASQQPSGYFGWCATYGIFDNFAFEVQLTIVQGDCAGMLFRGDDNGHFYKFTICEDGMYRVDKYMHTDGIATLQVSNSSAIRVGLGMPNKLAVVASGSTMTFYVNEQPVDQERDSSYTSGKIALVANPYYPDGGHATDVAYSNTRLWTL